MIINAIFLSMQSRGFLLKTTNLSFNVFFVSSFNAFNYFCDFHCRASSFQTTKSRFVIQKLTSTKMPINNDFLMFEIEFFVLCITSRKKIVEKNTLYFMFFFITTSSILFLSFLFYFNSFFVIFCHFCFSFVFNRFSIFVIVVVVLSSSTNNKLKHLLKIFC